MGQYFGKRKLSLEGVALGGKGVRSRRHNFVPKRKSSFDSEESGWRIADRKIGNTIELAKSESFNPTQSQKIGLKCVPGGRSVLACL